MLVARLLTIRIVYQSSLILIVVTTLSDKQVYEICIDDKAIRIITDIFGKTHNSFTRTISNQTFIVRNGEILFKTVERNCKFINKISKNKVISNRFLTLDLETRNIKGIHSPYCISFFDGKQAYSFYLSDFNGIDQMMKTALSSIMKRKYDGWNIYVHYGSGFDYIFLLKYITLLGEVDPLIKDGSFINIKLSWSKYNSTYSLNFRDSFLILPSSLRKLAGAFNVESKGYFPFKFVNNVKVPLNYIGTTPDLKFYEGISFENYQTMVTNDWNLRDECLKYCELDCRVLHQILSKFNDLIFTKWSLNIHRFPTLSSLAFGIYKSHYISTHKIPKLGGHIFDFIKQGYTGGRVDVIRPSGNI